MYSVTPELNTRSPPVVIHATVIPRTDVDADTRRPDMHSAADLDTNARSVDADRSHVANIATSCLPPPARFSVLRNYHRQAD